MLSKSHEARSGESAEHSEQLFLGVVRQLGVDTLLNIVRTTRQDLRSGRARAAVVDAGEVNFTVTSDEVSFAWAGKRGNLTNPEVRGVILQYVDAELGLIPEQTNPSAT